MNYKQLKEQFNATKKSNKYLKKCNKENRRMVIKLKEELNNQEIMFDSAMNLFTFSNMQIDFLLSTLEEVRVMTDDKLAIEVIKNAIERHNLDKMIHTRTLFTNPKGFNE